MLSLKVTLPSRQCIKVKQMEPTAKWIKCSFNLHYLRAGVTLGGSRRGARFLNENEAENNQSAPPRHREQTGRSELPPALFKERIQLKTNQEQKAASAISRPYVCAVVIYTSETLSHSGTGREGDRQQAGPAKCNWT